jgi:hypothetical protein
MIAQKTTLIAGLSCCKKRIIGEKDLLCAPGAPQARGLAGSIVWLGCG